MKGLNTNKIIDNSVKYINKFLLLEGIEFEKLHLGFHIIVLNISKTILVLLIAIYSNLVRETISVMIIFYSFRRYSFGLHAKSSFICTIISVLGLVGGGYLANTVNINSVVSNIIYIILSAILIVYSPADTENNPLIGEIRRRELKRKVIITTVVIFILKIIFNNSIFSNLILVGLIIQVLSVIPISYLILGRGYKNYEKYS